MQPNDAVTLSARVVGEMILGRIRVSPHHPEPPYLLSIRQFALQLKRRLKDEEWKTFTEDLRGMSHVLADALFDAVTDVQRDETIAKLKALPVHQRLVIEAAANMMTGKSDRDGRWTDVLWQIRKRLRLMTDLSISGITLAEVREAYDPFLHMVVDQVFDNKVLLVS